MVDNDTFALLRAGTESTGPGRRGLRRGHQLRGRLGGGRSGPLPVPGTAVRRLGWWRAAGPSEALWLAVRAEDGRGRPTALSRAVPDHFGLATVAEVSAAFHLGDLPAARLHELTPVLLRCAGAGDEVSG